MYMVLLNIFKVLQVKKNPRTSITEFFRIPAPDELEVD